MRFPLRHFPRDLPLTTSIERDGQRVLFCHSTPSDPLFAYCPSDSPAWTQESASVDADIILAGHTHLPFVKRFGIRTAVNRAASGSRKMADRPPSGLKCSTMAH
jgi:predicted phosphodiesterase